MKLLTQTSIKHNRIKLLCTIHPIRHVNPISRQQCILSTCSRLFTSPSTPNSSVPSSFPPPSNSRPSLHSHDNNNNSHQKKRKQRRLFRYVVIPGVIIFAAGCIWSLEEEETKSWQLAVMKTLPLRVMSRVWGKVHSMELPVSLRAPVYNLWTWMFNCNLDEMRDPLESYPNLGAFFTRYLKSDARPISSADIVSPVDALVTVTGVVTSDQTLDQIKGMSYKLDEFLGFQPVIEKEHDKRFVNKESQLYYCVLYLAPGDYHRIHSPANVTFKQRRHFPGHLFPVSPTLARYVPDLFIRNERIVLTGDWDYGFFGLAAVGAYNVGSVKLSYDEDVITNLRFRTKHSYDLDEPYGEGNGSYTRIYGKGKIDKNGNARKKYSTNEDENGLIVKKGDELARFELGSTVVLIFECKQSDFIFDVKPGDKVKMGQTLGSVKQWNQQTKHEAIQLEKHKQLRSL